MDTIIKTDAHGRERIFNIRVDRLRDGTANIVKTTGLVDGKKTTSTIHVPLGFNSASKRAMTIWKNKQESGVLPMLAHKWEDRKRYIQEPFYVQPKLDGVQSSYHYGYLARTRMLDAHSGSKHGRIEDFADQRISNEHNAA